MRQIPGASRYYATEDGRIWDEHSKRWKVQTLTGIPQYLYTTIIFDDGKKKLSRVHILVAKAYHPNPDNLPMVDHKDMDKMNNHKDNLRWVTRQQNHRNTPVNVYVEWEGENILLVELVERLYGVRKPHYNFLWRRVRAGDTIEQAVLKNNNYRGIVF